MQRIISSALLFSICALTIGAQSLDAHAPSASIEAKPQIAYRLFSTWADNYESSAKHGKAVASGILYGGAALCLGGSALTWYGGNEISQSISGSTMDPEIRRDIALGLGLGGGALLITGMIVSSTSIKDYRSIYADVFEEKDPEVQEAMAVSVLRYQADQGKERRITSFVSSFAVPILAAGIRAGINVAAGDPWGKDVLSSVQGASWWMVGGLVSLFQKSKEERLYERYLSTRDALYGSSR